MMLLLLLQPAAINYRNLQTSKAPLEGQAPATSLFTNALLLELLLLPLLLIVFMNKYIDTYYYCYINYATTSCSSTYICNAAWTY